MNGSTTIESILEENVTVPAILGNTNTDVLGELNATTSEYVPVLAASAVFGLLVLIGAIGVTLFIIVLIKGNSKFKEFPFFVIVWHMTVANAIHISMVISTIMPIMLLDIDDNSKFIWFGIGTRILELTEEASLYFTLLMTINRFAVFVWPDLLIIFTRNRTFALCVLIWLLVVFIVYWNAMDGSSRSYDKHKLQFDTVLGTTVLTKLFHLASTILPFVMLGMYIIIFAFLVKKRNSVSSTFDAEKDKSLLYQALVITIVLEISNLSSLFIPEIANPPWLVWSMTIFNFSTSILNQMVNPLMFLFANKMVHSILRGMIRKTPDGTSTHSTDSSNTRTNSTLIKRIMSAFTKKSRRNMWMDKTFSQ